MTLPSRPSYFQIDNRKYPMDQWTRNTFEKIRKQLGIKYTQVLEPIERKHEAIAFELAKDAHYYKLEFLANREIKSRMDLQDGKKKNLANTHNLRKLLTDASA